MTLKQFLKPERKKIVIFAIFIALIALSFLTRPPYRGSFFEHFVDYFILGPSFLSALLCPMYTAAVGSIVAPTCYTIFFGMIINAIYLYVISCLISLFYEKTSFFKINKKKIKITIILTVLLFVPYIMLSVNPLVYLIHRIIFPNQAMNASWIDVIYSEIFILFLESYLFSCLIVWIYDKIKVKKK